VTPKLQLADGTTENHKDLDSPVEVVTRFLNAMQEGDVETVIGLVADDIVYSNVSLPTIRGKDQFSKGARAYYRHHLGFQVVVHRIAGNGSSVLTERTDALILGPFRMQFWVCGVFEVENGQVTLWRDYFDWRSTMLATLRGLVGLLVPSLRAKFPATD
jgi:limonene-1,2-epoxide hydrolase